MFTQKIESVLSKEDRQAAWEEGHAAGRNEAEHILSKEDRQAAWEEGRAAGIEKGKTEERLANARKLKSLGVAGDIICQATGLSAEEVEAL